MRELLHHAIQKSRLINSGMIEEGTSFVSLRNKALNYLLVIARKFTLSNIDFIKSQKNGKQVVLSSESY